MTVEYRTPDRRAARFDYGTLAVEHAEDARAAAERIKARTSAAILDTGRDLIEIKGLLDHGQFERWLRAEFGMTPRTGQNYMRAALLVADKSETVSYLPAATVYEIARAPARVQDHVLNRLASGEIGADQVRPVLRAVAKELRLTSRSRSCAADPPQPQKDKAATRPTEPNADLAAHLAPIVTDAVTGLAPIAAVILEATRPGPDTDDRWDTFCRALRVGLEQAVTPPASATPVTAWQNLRDNALLSPTITRAQQVFLATLGDHVRQRGGICRWLEGASDHAAAVVICGGKTSTADGVSSAIGSVCI